MNANMLMKNIYKEKLEETNVQNISLQKLMKSYALVDSSNFFAVVKNHFYYCFHQISNK